jgi:hypothetical protein
LCLHKQQLHAVASRLACILTFHMHTHVHTFMPILPRMNALNPQPLARLSNTLCRPSGTEAAGRHPPDSQSQDCAVAKAAYAFGLHLQPERSPNRDLFDALELQACGVTPPQPIPMPPPSFPLPASGIGIYVDPASGSDTAAGTKESPLATLGAAVTMARGRPASGCVLVTTAVHPAFTHAPNVQLHTVNATSIHTHARARAHTHTHTHTPCSRTIVLRAGVHHITNTIEIGADLSGLTLQNYPGEDAWVSGGTPLTPTWEKAPGFPDR